MTELNPEDFSSNEPDHATKFHPTTPAWLVARVEQRTAEYSELLKGIDPHHLYGITIPLEKHSLDMTADEHLIWERTCDCCKKFVDYDHPFNMEHMVGRLRNGIACAIEIGLCDSCNDKMPDIQ